MLFVFVHTSSLGEFLAQDFETVGGSTHKKWKYDPSEGFPLRPFTSDMATRLPSGRPSDSVFSDAIISNNQGMPCCRNCLAKVQAPQFIDTKYKVT